MRDLVIIKLTATVQQSVNQP